MNKWMGFVAAAAVALLVPALASAQSSGDRPPGEPPFGISAQSNAGGTKITGVMFIEATNFLADGSADSIRAAARLRKGNELKTFFVEVVAPPVDIRTPGGIEEVQEVLFAALGPQIIDFFMGDACDAGCTLALKRALEFIDESFPVADGTDSQIIMTDLILVID